jgi:predicted house-cleaning noncanonical NTP pyrophosphatase (MazG superfamily)
VKQYNKLVRDRIPALLTGSGHKTVSKTLVGRELLAALRAKVDEELAEFDTAPDDAAAAGELADVIEVIIAIARQRGYDEDEMNRLRAVKTVEHGAFGLGYFLIATD